MSGPVGLPEPVAAFVERLSSVGGVEEVVLGGSRAAGTHRPDSDWDLGIFYRGVLDLDALRSVVAPAPLAPPGGWGPLMNGGAWVTVGGFAVDVLLRDADVVDRWTADAEHGDFEILAQNGYLAGAPTYTVAGERRLPFPEPLRTTAPPRWRSRAQLALTFAEQHERGGDRIATAGMLALAVLCEAHARLAERGEWTLNEKGLAHRAGLDGVPTNDVATAATALNLVPLHLRSRE